MHINVNVLKSLYTILLKSATKEYGQFGFPPKLPKSHTTNQVCFPEQFRPFVLI